MSKRQQSSASKKDQLGYVEEEQHRRPVNKASASKWIFALLTITYLFGEGYHLTYNMQVAFQHMGDPNYPQTKVPDYAQTYILTLIPGLLISIYGLTLCFFQDQSKVLKKAWFFKGLSLIYFYQILKGLYLIWYDWYYEHHHNYKLMGYAFYHDYALQWGPAFVYSLIFWMYARPCAQDIGKVKRH